MKADNANMIVPTTILKIKAIDPKTNMNSKTHGRAKSPRIIIVITSGMKFQTR